MRRSREKRIRVIAWIISLMVVISMGLSMAGALVTPRRVTPTPTPPPPTQTSTPTTM